MHFYLSSGRCLFGVPLGSDVPYPRGAAWWTRGVRCIGLEGYDLDNYTHFESSERIAELHRAQTEEIIKRY